MQPSAIFNPSPLPELRVVRGMLVFNMVFFAIVRTDSERTLTDCESNRQHSGFAAAESRRFTIWTCRRASPGITQRVLTAQFCRARDTGHAMGLGPIEITETLNHQIGQRVGFDVNAARFTQLAEKPPKGASEPVARIPVTEWGNLIKTDTPASP